MRRVTGRSGERGNCAWDVLYKRRIHKKKKISIPLIIKAKQVRMTVRNCFTPESVTSVRKTREKGW